MSDGPRTGQPPIEHGEKQEDGAPVTQAEVPAAEQTTAVRDEADIVTESDGAGLAGGSSGASGGGSSMPGHPDAAR
jgi:hypothetical protein